MADGGVARYAPVRAMTTLSAGPDAAPPPSLGRSARQGVLWMLGSRGGEQALSLLITIVLARLLSPADYGLIGMASLFLVFLGRFTDLGTGASIIQQRDLGSEQLSSIFWFNLMTGLALAVIAAAIAPLAARFFNEPRVANVLWVLALTLPLQALAVVPDSLLRRQLQFRRWVVRNIGAIAIAGAAGITVAWVGGGVWALVVQQVTQPLIVAIVLWAVVDWRPQPRFQIRHLREVWEFTTGVVGVNFLHYIGRNADYLLIGRYLGAVPLGLYTVAYRLMMFPVRNLAGVAAQALFPVFSRMQEDEARLAAGYIRVSRYISALTFPMMVGLALTARDFIQVVYGPRWLQSADLLVYLSLAGLLQPATSLFTAVVWAKGYSRWHLKYMTLEVGIMVIGFAVGLRWGVAGVARSYLATAWLASAITIVGMFGRCGISRAAFARALSAPAAAALAMTAGVVIMRVAMRTYGGMPAAAPARLLIDVAAGALLYGAVLWIADGEIRQIVRRYWSRLLRSVGKNSP